MALTNYAILHPITFPTSDPGIRIWPDSGGSGVEQTVTLSVDPGEYYWVSGDGETASGSRDILRRLASALNSATGGPWGFAVSIDGATGIITITEPNMFQILWDHVETTVDPALFGFLPGETTPSASLVAPNQAGGQWLPEQEVLFDSYDEPILLGATAESAGGLFRSGYSETIYNRQIRWGRLPAERVQTRDAEATKPLGAFETAWGASIGKQCTLRVYEDAATRTPSGYSTYHTRSLARPWRRLDGESVRLFGLDLDLRLAPRPVVVGAGGFPAAFSIDYDGANDYMQTAPSNLFDAAINVTVSQWIKIHTPAGNNEPLFNQWRQMSGLKRFVMFVRVAGVINLRVHLSSNGLAVPYGETTEVGGVIAEDTWAHVVWVFNGAGGNNAAKLKIYVDAVEITPLTFSSTMPGGLFSGTALPLSIAELADLGGSQFDGQFADVAAWVGTSATAGQVAEIYGGGQLVDMTTLATMPDPSLWYRMGNGLVGPDAFPNIFDEMGTGLTMVMNNQDAGDIVGDVPP